MKRYIVGVLLILLLAVLSIKYARAATNPCTGQAIPEGAPIDWYYDFQEWKAANAATPASAPPESTAMCMPWASTTSTAPVIHSNDAGVMGYNYCKVGPVWQPQKLAVTWAFLIGKNLAKNAKAALASNETITAFQQLVQAGVSTPLSDPSLTPVWCPWEDEIRKNRPAPDPPPPPPPGPDVWKALGSNLYTLTAGKLAPVYVTVNGKLTQQKAIASQLCEGAPFVSGTVTYMPLAGGPATQVTSCKKVTQ